MASKIFLDPNIVLDFTLKREGHLVARKIIELAVNGRLEAVKTPSIVHIGGYWLTKAYGNKKAKEFLLTLLWMFVSLILIMILPSLPCSHK